MQFSIDLTDDTPIYRRRHRLNKHEWELTNERCKEFHGIRLIELSSFYFVVTIVMSTKKNSIKLWTQKKMCGDYRPLNLVTLQDKYPTPILEELFDSLKRLHEVNMKIHPKKCEFTITSLVYLGHRILPNGIIAHWAKVVAILEMPNPTDVHTLRSFIKLCNYYRIYV